MYGLEIGAEVTVTATRGPGPGLVERRQATRGPGTKKM